MFLSTYIIHKNSRKIILRSSPTVSSKLLQWSLYFYSLLSLRMTTACDLLLAQTIKWRVKRPFTFMIIICFIKVSRESQPAINPSLRINYLFWIKSSSERESQWLLVAVKKTGHNWVYKDCLWAWLNIFKTMAFGALSDKVLTRWLLYLWTNNEIPVKSHSVLSNRVIWGWA